MRVLVWGWLWSGNKIFGWGKAISFFSRCSKSLLFGLLNTMLCILHLLKYPAGSDGIESACNAWVLGSVPGLGKSPGEGSGYPLQCSCLENFMDRGAWWAPVHGVAKSQARLSDQHFHFSPSISSLRRLLFFHLFQENLQLLWRHFYDSCPKILTG